MKHRLLAGILAVAASIDAQESPRALLSTRTAATIMATLPNGRGDVWNYEEGTALEGILAAGQVTSIADERRLGYQRYMQHCIDRFVTPAGVIRTYKPDDLSLDNILMGRQLLFLYARTGDLRYKTAAASLYAQLQRQPRIADGGFWHKKRYPDQMWLDGLYMAGPFYAEHAATFHHPEAFADIARQLTLLEQHTRDPKSGLLVHGWDASHQQRWANPQTGASPTHWSRAMGWYAMALVDTLDFIPQDHPAHARLVAMLVRFARAIVAAQNAHGVWYQVTDKPGVAGNYEESSASAMFVYALAKGVREHWLPATYLPAAQKGLAGIERQFVGTDSADLLTLSGTADAVGLGGNPYRDGSFAYYTSVPTVTNDARGLGALLLAASEMEKLAGR